MTDEEIIEELKRLKNGKWGMKSKEALTEAIRIVLRGITEKYLT